MKRGIALSPFLLVMFVGHYARRLGRAMVRAL